MGDLDAASLRMIKRLRALILEAAPHAVEAFRFHTLCYFDPSVTWGAIGGNICMIEIKRSKLQVSRPPKVLLTFILGSTLPDPLGILQGDAKFKRWMRVETVEDVESPTLKALIAASVKQARARAK